MRLPVIVRLDAVPPLATVFHRLNGSSNLTCLEIGPRYTVVACDPITTFASRSGFVTISRNGREQTRIDHPVDALQRFAAQFPDLPHDPYLPFYTGLIGYVSFEWGIQHTHPIGTATRSERPDAWFGWYDTVLVLDHREQCAMAIAMGLGDDGSVSEALAHARIENLLATLETASEPADTAAVHIPDDWQAPIPTATHYARQAQQVIGALRSGVAEKINFASCYQSVLPMAAPDLHLRMRRLNPTPYAMYLDIGSHQLCSSSPTEFLSLRDRTLRARPVLATQPCGPAPTTAHALLASTSDTTGLRHRLQAELAPLMIDQQLTVEDALLTQDKLAAQVVCPISGTLQPHLTIIDALARIVPGLSMTGFPKQAALQLLTRFEPVRRNAYTGAMGFIGANGQAQFNLSVRLLTLRDGIGSVHAANWLTRQTNADAVCAQTDRSVAQFFQRLLAPPSLSAPIHA